MSAPSTSGLSVIKSYCYELSTLNKVYFTLYFTLLFIILLLLIIIIIVIVIVINLFLGNWLL